MTQSGKQISQRYHATKFYYQHRLPLTACTQ